ncbi:MAG TPA: dolichyl-phosphate beta-glucosyltransferase [Candidatus Binatus sp.]|uniref:dolichyl-phosphate beta-glucosyltransferase n=1 Tax=Candidatus Binatus sp. TaxID=2811406 RepID=UPI002F3E6E2B
MAETHLSIVVPAYNEALRIDTTLRKIRIYAAAQPFPIEVVVVDDGSTDATAEVVARFPEVRMLRVSPNRGKGHAVRHGALASAGEFVLFTDADLSAPIEEADKLLSALQSGAAAAVGSRALRRELIGVRQPVFRDYSGRIYNLLVRLFTGLRIHDTQCGFKLFRMDATRRAFELQRVEGFGFDPELLFLIERTGGKIVEVPVRWNHDAATKVRFPRDPIRMFADLISLRVRSIGAHYSQ